jgi:hypothetical protein
MARITCEGSSEPEVQAEPEEAAMPSLFSSSRMPSPSMYSKAMLLVLGRRLSVAGREAMPTWLRMPRLELVAQALDAWCSLRHVLLRQFAGDAEADDGGRVLGAGAATALLMTTTQQRTEAGIAAQVEHADALGRMQLVAGEREHVDLGGLQVDGNLADRLHRVGMEHDALLVRHFGHFLDREDGPGFVVGPHRRNDGDAVVEQGLVFVEIDAALLVHPAACARRSLLFSSHSHSVRIAGCSTTVVITVLRSGWALSAERMAVESDSVPQEVNTISESCAAPSSACTWTRASFSALPTS